jgi:hypothetical protein
MHTNHTNTLIATPDFPGIVIDPKTGRKCALQIDIFRGLGLAGEQVTKTKARVYQNRFFDVEDVVSARAKVRPQGSRRPRGVMHSDMSSTENLKPEKTLS